MDKALKKLIPDGLVSYDDLLTFQERLENIFRKMGEHFSIDLRDKFHQLELQALYERGCDVLFGTLNKKTLLSQSVSEKFAEIKEEYMLRMIQLENNHWDECAKG